LSVKKFSTRNPPLVVLPITHCSRKNHPHLPGKLQEKIILVHLESFNLG